jgi:hypothetical protein
VEAAAGVVIFLNRPLTILQLTASPLCGRGRFSFWPNTIIASDASEPEKNVSRLSLNEIFLRNNASPLDARSTIALAANGIEPSRASAQRGSWT